MANNQKAPEKEKITTPVDEKLNETPKIEDVKENDENIAPTDAQNEAPTVEGSQEAPKAEETQENEEKNETPKTDAKKEAEKPKNDEKAPKVDAKNKKFKIKEGFGSLRVDGKLYQEGDEVEISEKQAKEIGII